MISGEFCRTFSPWHRQHLSNSVFCEGGDGDGDGKSSGGKVCIWPCTIRYSRSGHAPPFGTTTRMWLLMTVHNSSPVAEWGAGWLVGNGRIGMMGWFTETTGVFSEDRAR